MAVGSRVGDRSRYGVRGGVGVREVGAEGVGGGWGGRGGEREGMGRGWGGGEGGGGRGGGGGGGRDEAVRHGGAPRKPVLSNQSRDPVVFWSACRGRQSSCSGNEESRVEHSRIKHSRVERSRVEHSRVEHSRVE